MYVCMYVRMHACMYVCDCVRGCMCTYGRVHVCVCVCVDGRSKVGNIDSMFNTSRTHVSSKVTCEGSWLPVSRFLTQDAFL